MHEGARRLAETEVDVPSQHILVERGAAAVRHKLEAGTGLLLEVDAGDLWAADANCAYCRLARVFFQPGLSRNDPLRSVGQQRHWFEILHHVVLELITRAI